MPYCSLLLRSCYFTPRRANMINSLLLYLVVYLPPFLLLVHFAQNYWRLRHIPGPIVAKFTDLWRLLLVWQGRAELTYVELHEKYGDVVRIGPNCVSISKSDCINDIYGIGKGYIKASHNAGNGPRGKFNTDSANSPTFTPSGKTWSTDVASHQWSLLPMRHSMLQ